MKTLSNYPKNIYIGTVDNEKIYLSAPSWDCGWYWGFGYLGNRNCHYHVDGLNKTENIHLFDAFKKHFSEDFIVKSDSKLWTLCELFQTFYTLKETAEVLGRGGSHFTENPCKDLIINKTEVERINNVVLPQIFEEIYKILFYCEQSEQMYKTLVKLNLKGDTKKVVDFMNENDIKTDDLKNIAGISSHDFNVIHSYYWKEYHSKKELATI